MDNYRSEPRRRTRGSAIPRLTDPRGLFSPVWFDVVDLSTTGAGLIVPPELSWNSGDRWLLELPLRNGATAARLVEVRWVSHDVLFTSVGCQFVEGAPALIAADGSPDASGFKGYQDLPLA